jgi:hypothetical protein
VKGLLVSHNSAAGSDGVISMKQPPTYSHAIRRHRFTPTEHMGNEAFSELLPTIRSNFKEANPIVLLVVIDRMEVI